MLPTARTQVPREPTKLAIQSRITCSIKMHVTPRPPPGKKYVFFVRHGESKWNAAKRSMNVYQMVKDHDHPLNEAGYRQASSHFRQACLRERPHAPTHRSRRVGIWLFLTRQAKGLSDAIREKIAEGALDTWRDGEPCGEQGEAIRQFVTAQARQTAALVPAAADHYHSFRR